MFFNTKDASIYYQKYGNKDKTILILPGWGNTSATFYHIINYFKNNYTIYIIDYPGFGNSPLPNKSLTIYDYTNLIREFMNTEKIINPIIIAHSFGGRITTLLTGYYKEKIDKLILMDIASIKPRKTPLKKVKELTYKFLKKIINILPAKKRKYLQQKLLNLFASTDYQALPPIMYTTFKNIINTNLKAYLKFIESEALIIWGEKDKDTPLKDAFIINKHIKNSALIVYPKANHFSYLENPYLTNKIIYEFIKNED